MYWLGSIDSWRHSRKLVVLAPLKHFSLYALYMEESEKFEQKQGQDMMQVLKWLFNTSCANGSQQRNKINSGCKAVSLTTKRPARQTCTNLIIMM